MILPTVLLRGSGILASSFNLGPFTENRCWTSCGVGPLILIGIVAVARFTAIADDVRQTASAAILISKSTLCPPSRLRGLPFRTLGEISVRR
jgi:hypothetical protein